MNRNSELVGIVVDGTLVEDRRVDGEVFNRIQVKFRETEIPVLISEYVSTTVFEKDSKVKVEGCVISDINPGSLPKFYFYANTIELADIDSECTDVVEFSCTITKIKNYTKDAKCVEVLSLVGAYSTPIGSVSILYLYLKGKLARCLHKREKGYVVSGRGHLRAYKDVHEIAVTELDNLDKILTS